MVAYVSLNDDQVYFERNYHILWNFPLRNSCLSLLPQNAGMLTLLSNFHSIICQVVAYGRLKTKEYKSGHGGIQEIPNKEIRQGNFWYFIVVVQKHGPLLEVVVTRLLTAVCFQSKNLQGISTLVGSLGSLS